MNPTRKNNQFGAVPDPAVRRSRRLFDGLAERPRKLPWRRAWGIVTLATLAGCGFAAAAQDTNAPARTNAPVPAVAQARPDFSAFKMVVDRNIFDPNRFPQSGRSVRRATDYFEFVGTMSYEKGTFAVFTGSSSEYKKVVKLADTIADYKVTNIAPDYVSLAASTNEVKLAMNAQMRRDLDGEWFLTGNESSGGSRSSFAGSRRAGRFARNNGAGAPPVGGGTPAPEETTTPREDNNASNAASATASSGNESDIVKRMMQRREQEK